MSTSTQAEGVKTCSKCGETKPISEFVPARRWCKPCKREYLRQWHAQAPESSRRLIDQAHARYRAKNRKKIAESARVYRKNKSRFEPESGRRSTQYRRQERALLEGLTSPITKAQGFAVVLIPGMTQEQDLYRAARLDVPTRSNEVALVRLMPPIAKGERWGLSVWSVLPVAHRKIAETLKARWSAREHINKPREYGE